MFVLNVFVFFNYFSETVVAMINWQQDFVSSNSVRNHTSNWQIGLPLRSHPILLITRLITDQIGLHLLLLPLHIAMFVTLQFWLPPPTCWSLLFFFFPYLFVLKRHVLSLPIGRRNIHLLRLVTGCCSSGWRNLNKVRLSSHCGSRRRDLDKLRLTSHDSRGWHHDHLRLASLWNRLNRDHTTRCLHWNGHMTSRHLGDSISSVGCVHNLTLEGRERGDWLRWF